MKPWYSFSVLNGWPFCSSYKSTSSCLPSRGPKLFFRYDTCILRKYIIIEMKEEIWTGILGGLYMASVLDKGIQYMATKHWICYALFCYFTYNFKPLCCQSFKKWFTTEMLSFSESLPLSLKFVRTEIFFF